MWTNKRPFPWSFFLSFFFFNISVVTLLYPGGSLLLVFLASVAMKMGDKVEIFVPFDSHSPRSNAINEIIHVRLLQKRFYRRFPYRPKKNKTLILPKFEANFLSREKMDVLKSANLLCFFWKFFGSNIINCI